MFQHARRENSHYRGMTTALHPLPVRHGGGVPRARPRDGVRRHERPDTGGRRLRSLAFEDVAVHSELCSDAMVGTGRPECLDGGQASAKRSRLLGTDPITMLRVESRARAVWWRSVATGGRRDTPQQECPRSPWRMLADRTGPDPLRRPVQGKILRLPQSVATVSVVSGGQQTQA